MNGDSIRECDNHYGKTDPESCSSAPLTGNEPALLSEKIKRLPEAPGCYIFQDENGGVLYVGKSKCVRNRVRQYFHRHAGQPPKIRKLARLIRDVTYLSAETEIDALLLEHRLIKQYRPPFNSQMKRDRHPPVIQIDKSHDFPGVSIVYRPEKGCLRFGSFANGWDAEGTLTLLNAVWRIPLCGKPYFNPHSGRPCLNYYIGRCMAPCCGMTSSAEYRVVIRDMCDFLRGRNKRVLRGLKKDILREAEALAFERAARLRDQYTALLALSKRVDAVGTGFEGKRICVLIKGFHEDSFLLLYIRDGRTCLVAHFSSAEEWPGKKLERFVERMARKDWDNGLDLAAAVAEVRARKRFIDVSYTKKSETVNQLLIKAFPTFYRPKRAGCKVLK